MSQARQRPIYGNNSVYSPSGELMFRCDDKKVDWYLKRDLAEIIETEDGDGDKSIKLKFEPNGLGKQGNPFYLESKKNICCVCGSDDNLTRHHCVPYQYRKHFPHNYKKSISHDVVPLCISCHNKYEQDAWKLKIEVAKEYNVPIEVKRKVVKKRLQAFSAARAIVKHSDGIPENRKDELKNKIADYLGHQPSSEEIEQFAVADRNDLYENDDKLTQHGGLVVAKLDTIEKLDDFIKLWRRHFCNVTNPRYLPSHWNIDHPTSINQLFSDAQSSVKPLL